MALDFPATPAIGDLYPDPAQAGLPQYRWDGEAWLGGPVTPAGGENFVAKTGDTMSGNLYIVDVSGTSALFLDAAAVGGAVVQTTKEGVSRWNIGQTSDAETGGNTGSNFYIERIDDLGTPLGPAFSIGRADGTARFSQSLLVGPSAIAGYGDIGTARIDAPTTGAIYFGNAYSNILYTGADFILTGGRVVCMGGTVARTVLTVRDDIANGMYNCVSYINYYGGGDQFGISFRPIVDGGNVQSFCSAANAVVGSISQNASNTAFNTASSGELKENLTAFDAGPILDAIEVWNFTWKSTGEPAYGVIAQQVNEVFADAVTHVPPNTAMKDDEPTPEWWGVDYSKFVPLLLQEIKSLRARLAEVESKLV